jgi:phenylglyoxylate dehydrogenase epsilon subunit
MNIPIALIVDGGAAEAVLALRANNYAGPIHLFADNEHAPFNPMLGPYLVAGRLPLEQAFPFGDRDTFYGGNRVTAHLGLPVVSLDAEARVLTTASGETYEYERCLVATGARPAVPAIPGLREALAPSGAPGRTERQAFTLQTLDEALALKQAVDRLRPGAEGGEAERPRAGEPPRAAVVGASFAGVKIAAVLREIGFQVTLIERETSILPLSAHPDCARIMEARLLEEGYRLRLGAALTGVVPGPDGVCIDFGALPGAADPGGAGGTACEESPTQEIADLVVVCTGTRPSLSFLAPGQVATGVGILVDEQMRSNIPTLYAAGDVAQGKNLLSGRADNRTVGQRPLPGRAADAVPPARPNYLGSVPHITHVGACCRQRRLHERLRPRGGLWRRRHLSVRVWQDGRLAGVNLLIAAFPPG